jgi:hypothetical protein
MNNKLILAATTAAFITAANASAVEIYNADFDDVVVIDHTTTGNALESSPQTGSNFTLSYPSAPASDTTRNFFESGSGVLVSEDFGGAHTFESSTIDLSLVTDIVISFEGETDGTDVFNGGDEFLEYFYTLDGGAEQLLFTRTTDGSLDFTSSTIDTTSATSLTIGLNANINGSNDGFTIESAIVTGTVIPEPASIAGLGLLGLVGLRRRRA